MAYPYPYPGPGKNTTGGYSKVKGSVGAGGMREGSKSAPQNPTVAAGGLNCGVKDARIKNSDRTQSAS